MFLASLLLTTLTTTADINASLRNPHKAGQPFELKGTVTAALFNSHCIIEDETGRMHVRNKSETIPAAGDRVSLSGYTSIDSYGQEQTIATNLTILGAVELKPPQHESVSRITRGEVNFANVQVEGTVAGCFSDDIDSNWNYLILKSEGSFTYVSVPNVNRGMQRIEDFSRALISVRGTVINGHCGARCIIGPHIETSGFGDIRLLKEPSADSAVTSAELPLLTPDTVVGLGPQMIDGVVVACWGNHNLLLRDMFGGIHRVDLQPELDLPAVGSHLQVIGHPETDLYRINLSKARVTHLPDRPAEASETVPNWKAVEQNPGLRHQTFHGRFVGVRGRILAEATDRCAWRAILETDTHERIAIDVSTVPDCAAALTVGSTVAVTGCGLIDLDNWKAGVSFPQQKELVVIVRTPEDITILSRPSWWTTGRLLAVIGILLGLLVAIVIWNRILNRLVERRGRMLYRETLTHAAAEFRVVERTRLATEMHDSLSQSLTGISCQIDAMEAARVKRPDRLAHHLSLARNLLANCRTQLRYCLWDLRNNILSEPDAETAIRTTILSLLEETELAVTFPIPRQAFSDTTFHELLCILRELAANAIRHGGASKLTITGDKSATSYTITIVDNGCGFDPEHRPGSAEGHFGLLGVSERVERLNGTFTITSQPGLGTTASVTLPRKS